MAASAASSFCNPSALTFAFWALVSESYSHLRCDHAFVSSVSVSSVIALMASNIYSLKFGGERRSLCLIGCVALHLFDMRLSYSQPAGVVYQRPSSCRQGIIVGSAVLTLFSYASSTSASGSICRYLGYFHGRHSRVISVHFIIQESIHLCDARLLSERTFSLPSRFF